MFPFPLALWLSELTGHIYGTDENTYGRAFINCCCWHPLPRGAIVFINWLEHAAFRPVTGYEALLIPADAERARTSHTVIPMCVLADTIALHDSASHVIEFRPLERTLV